MLHRPHAGERIVLGVVRVPINLRTALWQWKCFSPGVFGAPLNLNTHPSCPAPLHAEGGGVPLQGWGGTGAVGRADRRDCHTAEGETEGAAADHTCWQLLWPHPAPNVHLHPCESLVQGIIGVGPGGGGGAGGSVGGQEGGAELMLKPLLDP